MIPRVWVALIISLLIGGASGLFFTLFEKKESGYRFGYSREARLNHLLAARRFLKHMGIPAENMATPSPASTLPPTSGVILLTTERLTVNTRTQDALLGWVRDGGYLILAARYRYGARPVNDRLLKKLGLEVTFPEVSRERRHIDAASDVRFPDSDNLVRVKFDPGLRLQPDNQHFQSLAGDSNGEFVVTRKLGAGNITVMSDRGMLHNRRIGYEDHAQFLFGLINLAGHPEKVWLIAEDNMPGLHAWLWKHAPEAVICAAILMLMILPSVSHRFGPIIEIKPSIRRRLLEHIQASGRFLWRHQHYRQLLTGMQLSLKHEMAVKHPGMRETDSSTAAQLADFVDMDIEEIRRALGVTTVNSKQEFTNTVRLYERLRKKL